MIKPSEVKFRVYRFADERSIINVANNIEEVIRIVKKHPEMDWEDVLKDIEYCTKKIEKLNQKGFESVVYETKGYNDSSLAYNDKRNKGEVLLFKNPTCSRSIEEMTISNLTIANIKSDLRSILPDGTNYVLAKYRRFGVDTISRLLESIELYEEQVERQAQLTDSRKCNIFKLDYANKKKIVLAYYRDIVETLLKAENKGLIWGELSDNQRRLYLESLMSDSMSARTTKSNLVDVVANYTTIDELESFKKGNEKVLSRFIR